MKTIIQVVQHLTPGGIEVMALEMLRLREKDTHMLIVSLEGQEDEMHSKWPRLLECKNNLVFLEKRTGFSMKTIAQLVKLFVRTRPVAIHTHHIGPLIYAGIAARIAGIKNIIHTEHDAWHLQDRKRRTVEKNVLKIVRPTLVADSRAVEIAFNQFIPNVESTVILNGIDTDKFSPGDKMAARKKLDLPIERLIIGCAGRLEKEKGQTILIEALVELPEYCCVVLAGTGSQQDLLVNLVERLDLTSRVYFLGHQEDMVTFYRSLDLFCMPSYNEGMPLAPLEAQSCNIPSILTAVGGCKESICPITGSLVQAGNPIAMAAAITKTINSDSPNSPRNFVVENANAKSMTQQYHNLCIAR